MWVISVLFLAFIFYLAYRGKKICDEYEKMENIDLVCSGCPYKDDCTSGYEPCRGFSCDSKSIDS